MYSKFSGDKVRFLRKEKKLTQAELADKIQVNISTLAKWERNEQIPSVDNANLLAQTLGVSINDFFINDQKESLEKINEGIQTMTYKNGEQELTVPYDRELSLKILKAMLNNETTSINNGMLIKGTGNSGSQFIEKQENKIKNHDKEIHDSSL